MVVHLSGELERRVQAKVDSGHYGSASEVIQEALAALDERERELDSKALAFQSEIARRLAEGPATPMDFAALKSRVQRAIEAKKAIRS